MSGSTLVPSQPFMDRYRSSLGRERAAWPFEQKNAGVQLAWRGRVLEAPLQQLTDVTGGRYKAVGATSYGVSDEVRILLRERDTAAEAELVWDERQKTGRVEGDLSGVSAEEWRAMTRAAENVAARWHEADASVRTGPVPDVVIARHNDQTDAFATQLRDRGVKVPVVNVSRPENAWILDRVNVDESGQRLVVIADDRASELSHPMWRGSHPNLEREALDQLAPQTRAATAALVIASTPDCTRCRQWSNLLTRKGIPHQSVDVTKSENADLARTVKTLGYTQAPVTFVPDSMRGGDVPPHFGEMRPDLLAKIRAGMAVDACERDRAHFPQGVGVNVRELSVGVEG